ncbi:MAG: ABC transporter ATP-binding protein [Phycisphaerales bacterium]|nr:ABC transporter ATP-binding protein [Phycisphaerales bacterium]
MIPIRLGNLSKHYGETKAVDAVDLTIPAGSLFFLLGSSGCGKTTILRMIAGFIEPTAGTIHLGEREVSSVRAEKRECGMVFQSYALWPHMTVAENVAFGLEVRKVSADDKRRRVGEALEMVRMSAYAQRKPVELSGGQQQRVALARAIVFRPKVLLLDEPLSNLDAKLRLQMRSEIKRICNSVGLTTVYVTHDQDEALSMADQMVVMDQGRIVQQGTPRDLYERPRTRFIADFLGETNLVEGVVTSVEGIGAVLQTSAGALRCADGRGAVLGSKRVVSIRNEAWSVCDKSTPGAFFAKCAGTVYLGATAQHLLEVGSMQLKVLEHNPRLSTREGQSLSICCASDQVIMLDDGA